MKIFSILLLFLINTKVLAAEACKDDNTSWCVYKACPNNSNRIPAGVYYYWTLYPMEPVFKNAGTNFANQEACFNHLKSYICNYQLKLYRMCIISSQLGTSITNWPYGRNSAEYNNYCNGESVIMNADNFTTGSFNFYSQTNWHNYIGGKFGIDPDEMSNDQKSSFYGAYTCQGGNVIPPDNTPSVQCGMPPVITADSPRTCTGSAACKSTKKIVPDTVSGVKYNYFCINDKMVKCPEEVKDYETAEKSDKCKDTATPPPTPNLGCDIENKNQTVTVKGKQFTCLCSTFNNPNYNWVYCSSLGNAIDVDGVCREICVLRSPREGTQERIDAKSPLRLFKVLSDFLFYTAVFVFFLNFLIVGFQYVRSSGEPDKLKAINERLSGNLYGFIFVLLIGALLNYLVGILSSAIK